MSCPVNKGHRVARLSRTAFRINSEERRHGEAPLRTYFIISLILFIGLTIYGLWHGLLF